MKISKLIAVIIFFIILMRLAVKPVLRFLLADYIKLYKKVEIKDPKLPFRKIITDGKNPVLIPYEYYEANGVGGAYTECSAIIKLIHPDNQDYKSICRMVVTDIRQTIGNNEIEVSIYDDYQSYLLGTDYIQRFKVLNAAETDSVKKHTIAIYYGNMYGNDNRHILRYYPELRNRQTENEYFYP